MVASDTFVNISKTVTSLWKRRYLWLFTKRSIGDMRKLATTSVHSENWTGVAIMRAVPELMRQPLKDNIFHGHRIAPRCGGVTFALSGLHDKRSTKNTVDPSLSMVVSILRWRWCVDYYSWLSNRCVGMVNIFTMKLVYPSRRRGHIFLRWRWCVDLTVVA